MISKGFRFHFPADLYDCFTCKGFFIFLCSNNLLGKQAQEINVFTGINLSKGSFKVELLLQR